MTSSRRAWLAFFAIGFTVGCVVSLDPDTLIYSCRNDGDCGGDGYSCVAPPGKVARCCKASGAEICNGKDDDCNGEIDEGGPAETCNGLDDDCDGTVDNGFNLQTDSAHCGQCGKACLATQLCEIGACRQRGEILCSDGLDNDGDSKIDCLDSDCSSQSCGAGCQCRDGGKAESDCTNFVDDDGDGPHDCADLDCDNVLCSGGCTCRGGIRTETNCADMVDNDGDGGTDCGDPTCAGLSCKAAPQTFTCLTGQCACRDAGTSPAPETGQVRCRNGTDDDCNGLSDCSEAGCSGISCESDGGNGCQCRDGGKVELNCFDRLDNDGDLQADCGEMFSDGGGECPVGTRCTFVMGIVRDGGCKWDVGTGRGICTNMP